MTDLITDEAVKSLLDGATPGPWRADGEPWNRIVWSSADNRVCFMAHSSGLNDARDIATSNLIAAAPDLARALLDARAEHAASLIRINAEAVEAVAQARADAQAAVALALEEAAENKEQLEIWAHEILVGLAFADVLKIDSYNDKIEAHDMVGRGLVEVIRALAPADGLAAVDALRAQVERATSEIQGFQDLARENMRQWGAAVTRAETAEADLARALLDARAELARVKADAAAAQALMVERAAEVCDDLAIGYAKHKGVPDALHDAARDIRALTPDAGTAELVRLRERAEKADGMVKRLARRIRNQRVRLRQMEGFKCRCCDFMAVRLQQLKRSNAYRADCDRLAAANAVLEAKVAGLRDFVDDFAKAKIDALRYSPPYGSSPEDDPDPVVDAETVWAWQADAKAALATQEAGNA